MDQRNKSTTFEKSIEEDSLYYLKLRAKYGGSNYYRILKKLIAYVFEEEEIEPFSSSEYFLYILFSPQIQSELKRGLKALKSFINEGGKKYLTTQLEAFERVLANIYEKSLDAEIPVLLVEIALKKWLKLQTTDEMFESIYKKFIFMVRYVRKSKVASDSGGMQALEFLDKSRAIHSNIHVTKSDDIIEHVEHPSLFKDLLKVISDRYAYKPQIKRLNIKKDKVKKRIKETQYSVKNKIKEEMKMVLSSIDGYSIDKIQEAISEMNNVIIGGDAKLRGLKLQLLRRDKIYQEEEFDIPELIKLFLPNIKEKLETNFDEISMLLQNKLKSVPEEFIEKRFLGRKCDYRKILDWFIDSYANIFVPTLVELVLEEMVRVWPVAMGKTESFEEARWIGLLARKVNPTSVFFIPSIDRKLSPHEKVIKNFRKTISVMVYDIRGSSIMGEKLQDASMEDEIRNLFQKQLSVAVRENNGFLLKDTGDGGIVFFSANSGELFADYRAFLNGSLKDFNLSGLKLTPSSNSARRAISCAKQMISLAEEFVRKNLRKYSEWFKDFKEEAVGFGGITYEKLPPEYRKIFQIGVGIASGKPNEDVFLGPNVIGTPDLTGSLVRKANAYSEARHPDRSVILIDGPTMCNFMLSLEEFDSTEEDKEIKKHSYTSRTGDLRREAIQWMKGLSGKYRIADFKISLERIDILMDNKGDIDSVETEESGVMIKKGEKFTDTKTGIEKVAYEVIPEDRR